MFSVCAPQNHPTAFKYNKKQLCDEVPCGIYGMIYVWNSHNTVGYKQYQQALIRRHMALELFPLVNESAYIVLA